MKNFEERQRGEKEEEENEIRKKKKKKKQDKMIGDNSRVTSCFIKRILRSLIVFSDKRNIVISEDKRARDLARLS